MRRIRLALLALLPPLPLAAQEGAAPAAPKPLAVADFLAIPMLSAPALSPDGSRIAYQQTTRDLKQDKYARTIHLVETASGQDLALTGPGHNDWNPLWSPAGTLLFLSDRGGQPALYESRLDGADPRPAAGPRKGGLSAPALSPDGKLLAFLAPPAEAKGFGTDPEVRTALEDPAEWPQLWLLDRETGKERQLTDGNAYIYDFDWHPAGKSLVLTLDPRGSSAVTEDHHLALIDLEGRVELLSDAPARHAVPRFSPDGGRVAFLRDRHVEQGHYVNVTDLFAVDLATRVFTHLTAGAPFDCASGEWLAWSADGRWLWFLAGERARRHLWRVAAAGGKPEAVGRMETGSVVQVGLAARAGLAAFTAGDLAQPADLHASALDRWEPRRLTRVREGLAGFGLRPPLPLAWSSPDGTTVEGFLFLPPGLKPGEKAPMVVEIHGGPSGVWLDAFSHRYLWHVFAGRGWATLLPNIRGSQTYGEHFLAANLSDFGGKDFEDALSGVDAAIGAGAVDPERLAISGYSYGGFMVNLAVTKTDRFKAAVSIAGGFNFLSCFGQTNPVLPEVYYDPLGSPARLEEAFRESPVAAVHNVRTPLLLMHGKADEAVHYMQSVEFFTCLQLLERPSRLILYPGEGHGINRPTHMKHYMEAELEWIAEHLGG